MLLIRVAFLALLICLHVIGGAVLFRRIFPRESPWWGFFLPTLALVSLLNFIEHAVALPSLVWLLPLSSGGLIWVMAHPGTSWKGLVFPSILFLVIFSFTLAVKCVEPDVNFYCTEGLTDLNRILDFCLGDTVPPTDCWLPPYKHVGYYTFMHYGTSVLKRLLAVDIGTAYNLGSALLNALAMLATAAAAHTLSRFRKWVAVVTAIVMMGGWTGSTPIHAVLNPTDSNPVASIDIGGGDPGDTVHKEFAWLLKKNQPDIAYRIYTPGCYIYYSEFHATMAGHFLALLSVFGVAEVLRRKRAIFPWIYLAVAPFLTILSCPWFFFIVTLLAWPTLLVAWAASREPTQWRFVFVGAAVGMTLLWPSLNNMFHGASPEPFYWTNDLNRDFATVVIQWWPIYVPWILLWFAWPCMNLGARWLHFVLIPICFCVEAFFFTDRGTTLEKTWGGTFGIGLAILFPLVFTQKNWLFRILSAVLILCGFISLGSWADGTFTGALSRGPFLRLEGNFFIKFDPQLNRMDEVLSRVRCQTVLTGKAWHAWFESPALPAFTENRSFLGWTNAEETAGHPVEANVREKEINSFYDGTMQEPLSYLAANDISAVLVWPGDKMSQDWLDKMKVTLDPEFTYFDCKGDGDQQAGIFLKRSTLQDKSARP
jgi:hypothetical protein